MTDDGDQSLAAAYSEIAPYYVRLWAPVLLPMGRQLLDRLPLPNARRVLDLGAGSGTLLDDLAVRAPTAQIFAMDIAEGMLRVAKQRHDAGFAVSDARALPITTGVFDVVVSAFVLFNVPEPVAALREVVRVLRPGGMFGMATWGDEPEDAMTNAWNEELSAYGAPDDPAAPDGREAMDTPAKLSALLAESGFVAPETWTDRLAYTWRAEDCLEFLQHGRRKRRLDALAPEAQRACLARVEDRFYSLTPEQLTERSEVIFATAAGPGDRA